MGVSLSQDELERRVDERTAELVTALQKSEARFRALIENSLDVTVIINGDLRVQYVSPSVTSILGYDPGDVAGAASLDFVHPEDAPMITQLFAQATSAPGVIETKEFRALHKDGSWRVMDAVGLNLLHDPAVAGMVVTLRDITARRALRGAGQAVRATRGDRPARGWRRTRFQQRPARDPRLQQRATRVAHGSAAHRRYRRDRERG